MGPWLIITPAWAAPAAHLVAVSARALAEPAIAAGSTAVVAVFSIAALALLLGLRARARQGGRST